MAQGSGEQNRIGNHINPTFFGVRYRLNGVALSGQLMTKVRIMAVQFNSNTSFDVPTWARILQNTGDPFSYRHTDYTKQFRILYDAKHLLINNTASDAFMLYGEISIPKERLQSISFNDNLTTGENKVYLMALSDYNDADLDTPELSFSWRLMYTDA